MVDDVTICEELGHGAFGKVYKGILKVPSLKKKAKWTMTVAVKMFQGMDWSIRYFLSQYTSDIRNYLTASFSRCNKLKPD